MQTNMKRLAASLTALLFWTFAAPSMAAVVTYPGPSYTNDAGTKVTPTSVTVASITTKAGVAIAGATATGNIAGSDSSVDYDAAAFGEGWIVLTPVLAGSTFANNAPHIYCSADPQTLAATNTITTSTNNALVLATGVVGASPTTTVIPTNLTAARGDIYSGNEITWLTGPNQGKTSHVLSWSATGSTMTLVAPTPNTPTAGDTFSMSPYSKGLATFTANLGTDGKIVLSANTQPAIIASNVTGDVGGKILGGGASTITGDGVRAASVTGSVGSISGITFPSNFGTFSIDATGKVTLVAGQSISVNNLPYAQPHR